MHTPLWARNERDPLANPDLGLYERRSERLIQALWRLGMVLLVAAVVTTAAGLLRYEPLVAHSGTASGDAVSVEMVDGGPVYTVTAIPAGTFSYEFSLNNAGRWGVTVTDLIPPAHGAFADTEVILIRPGSTEPLDDVAFRSGEHLNILVRVTFAMCQIPPPAGSRDQWSWEDVRFRLLGLPRAQPVDLPMALRIDASAIPSC